MALQNVGQTIDVVKQYVNARIDLIHGGVKYAANSTYGRRYLPSDMQEQLTNDQNKTRNVALAILVGTIALAIGFEAIAAVAFTAVKITMAFGLIYTVVKVCNRSFNNSVPLIEDFPTQ